MLFSLLDNTHAACENAEDSVPLSAPYLITYILVLSSVQSLSRVWLCDPMDCSMPGFPCSSSRYFSSLVGPVFCNRPHIQENNSFFLQLILPLPLYILFPKEASSTPNINSTPGKVVLIFKSALLHGKNSWIMTFPHPSFTEIWWQNCIYARRTMWCFWYKNTLQNNDHNQGNYQIHYLTVIILCVWWALKSILSMKFQVYFSINSRHLMLYIGFSELIILLEL